MKKRLDRNIGKYTAKEIKSKIAELEKRQAILKKERTEISQTINNLTKQIEYWQTFDKSQLKLI